MNNYVTTEESIAASGFKERIKAIQAGGCDQAT